MALVQRLLQRSWRVFAAGFLAASLIGRVQGQIDSTGIKLIEQRKYAEAQSFFEGKIEANKKDADAHFQLARALYFQRNYDDAHDAIDDALDLNDKDARYHLLRGQILGTIAQNANVFKQGILAPKVKNAFLRAVELDPTLIEARSGLFSYYSMAPGIMGGSEEEALKQADEIIKLNPFRGHLILGNYYQRKEEVVRAEAEFKKAIEAEPKNVGGHKRLGYLYVNQKQYNDAYAQFQVYIDIDPKNPDAYDSYGDALFAQEKYDEAIEKYNTALFLNRSFSSSIFQLGACYEKKGLKSKAVETYQWYLTVEPTGRNADAAKKKIKELS